MYPADEGSIHYFSDVHIPEKALKTMQALLLPRDLKAKISKVLHSHSLFGGSLGILLLMSSSKEMKHWYNEISVSAVLC